MNPQDEALSVLRAIVASRKVEAVDLPVLNALIDRLSHSTPGDAEVRNPMADEHVNWLVHALEAWPGRPDRDKTANIEYLMKEAAKVIRATPLATPSGRAQGEVEKRTFTYTGHPELGTPPVPVEVELPGHGFPCLTGDAGYDGDTVDVPFGLSALPNDSRKDDTAAGALLGVGLSSEPCRQPSDFRYDKPDRPFPTWSRGRIPQLVAAGWTETPLYAAPPAQDQTKGDE